MALRRFWIDVPCAIGRELVIGDELFHHIRDVCRFSAGDRFELLPGDGKAYLAEITSVRKRDLLANLVEERRLEELKRPWIHLALSVPKYPKVDFVVEKSVELGVQEISLFVSDYSFPRKLSDLSDHRMQRWEKIIKSATQQCGRGSRMRLNAPRLLPDLLKDYRGRPGAYALFPYEGAAALEWKQAMQSARKASPEEVFAFIGSEGGFSPGEVELFQQFGLQPMTMGQQILRVETACVAMVSVIKYEFEV